VAIIDEVQLVEDAEEGTLDECYSGLTSL